VSDLSRKTLESYGFLETDSEEPALSLFETRVRHHRQDGDGSLREDPRESKELVTDDELLAELDKLK